MAYGIVETTNVSGRCFSMKSATNIENGAVVAKGSLVTGEEQIYTAGVPATTDKVYLVANPAWKYENFLATDDNETEYINKAGIPYRAYELKEQDTFKVMPLSITPITSTDLAVGQLVVVDGTTNKLKAVASTTTVSSYAFVGEIISIENIGFPYCVGSAGTAISIGDDDDEISMGSALDLRSTKLKIRVVKNA